MDLDRIPQPSKAREYLFVTFRLLFPFRVFGRFLISVSSLVEVSAALAGGCAVATSKSASLRSPKKVLVCSSATASVTLWEDLNFPNIDFWSDLEGFAFM